MPKRRGRQRGVLPAFSASSPSMQTAITSFAVPVGAGVSADRGGQTSILEGETSLSPMGPGVPPRPGTVLGTLLAAQEAPELFPPEVLPISPLTPDEMHSLSTRLQPTVEDGGTVSCNATEKEKVESSGVIPGTTLLPPLIRPDVIDMEAIWSGLELLYKVCSQFVTSAQSTNIQFKTFDEKLLKQSDRIGKLEKSVTEAKASINLQLKDKNLLVRKLKNLENANRSLNLRLLHFPISKFQLARELFHSFLRLVLKFPENNLPPLHKSYYLNIPKEDNGKGTVAGDLDLTAILETSQQKEIMGRATLLVTFVFQQDKEAVLRLFYKTDNSEFHGSKVSIFPDVSKWTQDR